MQPIIIYFCVRLCKFVSKIELNISFSKKSPVLLETCYKMISRPNVKTDHTDLFFIHFILAKQYIYNDILLIMISNCFCS